MQRKGIKPLARKLASHLPDDGQAVKTAYKYAKLMRFKAAAGIRKLRGSQALAEPDAVFWIDPARIKLYTNAQANASSAERAAQIEQQDFHARVFDREQDKGKVVGGDWDLSDLAFKDLEVYAALEARITENASWQDSAFYATMKRRIEGGESVWTCSNVADLDARCAYLDELIESIKVNGFKRNCDVVLTGEDPNSRAKHPDMSAEVLVNIGRNGEYLFQDGRHRLAIAQLLEVPEIPVKVLVRHQQWQDLREHLSAMVENSAGASKRGVLYQSPIHTDLIDFPATHSCENRFEVLKPFMEGRSGNFLDVGANLGYFSHKAEDLGFDCYAIELLPEVVHASSRIRDAQGKKFKIIEGDLARAFESPVLQNKSFDTVIVLNILHHSLLRKEKYDALLLWLKQLKVKQLFLETHRTDEHHMVDAYANLEPEEFVKLILEHTELTDYEFLQTADDGRKIFRLFV